MFDVMWVKIRTRWFYSAHTFRSGQLVDLRETRTSKSIQGQMEECIVNGVRKG